MKRIPAYFFRPLKNKANDKNNRDDPSGFKNSKNFWMAFSVPSSNWVSWIT